MFVIALRRMGLLLVLAAAPTTVCAAAAPAPLHWTRLRISRALPSQVFARLGIGHNTRRGYTRDGAKKTDPDPTFPPGLTDIVPLDSERLLLVRGTDTGLAAFKLQVAQAEAQVTAVRWHIATDLIRASGSGVTPIGLPAAQDTPDNSPVVLMLGAEGDRPYQIRVLPNAQGLLKIVWQRGLLLSRPGVARGVLAPDIAWSAGVARTVAPGEAATFDDIAADRIAARQALGLPPETLDGDYAVRVTATLLAPPLDTPAPPAAMPPVTQ